MSTPKPIAELTDEELFDAIREHVNQARNDAKRYARKEARAVFSEAQRRGWKLHQPSEL